MLDASLLRATIVIPCYNEAKRLDVDEVEALLADPRIQVLMVDDGSTDATGELLTSLSSAHRRVQVLTMPQNAGKAEAVRAGLNQALGAAGSETAGRTAVGYADADFATPASEVIRLVDELQRSGAAVVMGSRVARLGADIARSRARHYLGRVFASVASVILKLPVYDTQCGAKVFRDVPTLRRALALPFASRWVFDVELIGRLIDEVCPPALTASDFLEVPLLRWHDVGGSKLGMLSMFKAGWELLKLGMSGPARGSDEQV
jgi:dolichyl-phosphate beta-glucosyltransferase